MTRVQLSLAAAIALVAAGAGIGALVFGSDQADGTRTSAADGAAGPGSPTSTIAGQGDSTARTESSNTPVSGVDANDAKTATASRAWRTPASGTYRYHHSRTGAGAAEYDSTFVIAPAGPRAYTDSRERDSVKSVQFFSLDSGTLRQTKLTVDRGSGLETCRWDNPVIVLPAQPKDGQEWTSKTSCSWRLAEGEARTELESTLVVVGTRDGNVNGATVPLLRIDGKSTARTTSPGGTVVRASTFVEYYDTARGLLAQATQNVIETGPSGETSYRIVETMLTVEPEVPKQ